MAFKENLLCRGYFGYKPKRRINDNKNLILPAAPPPTGKSFKLAMATMAHWTKDGTFDEEYLFWDNQTYMNQIGLGK